ncbi:Low affinity sulfate transporter 3 [Senna tora]|uniref:Low affinity sulfate transporter 3 n=1 Tax=Senna tora TaxID=362788 RepID=A0A834W791_9FABA|nr:Low affinity sulfate transporter 3 [Senna tora]
MRKEESFLLPRIVVESLKFSSSYFSNWSSFICSKLSDQKTKIRRLRVQTETRDILALPSLGLGFLVDFLSHAALVGFMAGAAIMICLKQLKGLLGITHFTNKTDAVSVLGSVYKSLHHQLASGSADKGIMNFINKSTQGFSIGYVLLDLCGGLANVAQMLTATSCIFVQSTTCSNDIST